MYQTQNRHVCALFAVVGSGGDAGYVGPLYQRAPAPARAVQLDGTDGAGWTALHQAVDMGAWRMNLPLVTMHD